ncbi:unnamed protein product [Bursaphelenchus xylophilus]|uniref:(pine wood nematode) hypothetical protein n=1 Tax=Bursaphelenchus xylophilus TaxID=6326 RepID=A0A1I7RJ84_BURXY|nr:unnamed protein product [Bursaphelenchus xylophilus]CAG9119456.1 unnamed protein product [Bursaphelenchus xylophilus]
MLPMPYIAYVLWSFEGTGTLYSMHYVFWSSTFYFGFYPALSISILFLALDRIITITLFTAHVRTVRASLAIFNVLSQLLIYFFVVCHNSVYAPDTAARSDCVSYGCAGTSKTSQNSTFLWTVNLPIVFTNVMLGCAFYFLYHKRQKAMIARANKKVNQIAISAVAVEFFLKVTPYGLSYVITKLTGANLPKLFGPYFIYFHAVEIGSLVFSGHQFIKIKVLQSWLPLSSRITHVLKPLILLLITVCLFYDLYWKRRNLPPGPTPWPIFGNLLQAALQPPTNAFLEWKKKYGSVFTFWRGDMPTVMLADYAAIEHVLTQLPETLVDRVPMHSFNAKYRSGDHGVLFISGTEWRDNRRYALQIFREFGMGKNVMEQKMLAEIEDTLRTFTDYSASTEPQDICYDINRAVGNIINSLLFGYRFEGAKQEEYDELQRRVSEHVKMLAHPLVMIGTYRIDTFEKLPFVNGALKRLQQTALDLTKFFRNQISEHEKELQLCGDAQSTDYVESYLKQMHKRRDEGDYESFSHDILASMCYDLWLAGQESTSNTINWGIAYLANNPDIQDRVFQDIQNVVGERPVTMADRPGLPYLNAIVSESQRIANIIPALVPRRHHKDLKINGFTIKAGTAIVPQVSAVLYDENVFPNPHNFNPDRFLDENGHYRKIDEFIPFIVGKRNCLGEGLARMELFLFMSNLLARFKFLPENRQIDVSRVWGGTATMNPWKCKVIPRF